MKDQGGIVVINVTAAEQVCADLHMEQLLSEIYSINIEEGLLLAECCETQWICFKQCQKLKICHSLITFIFISFTLFIKHFITVSADQSGVQTRDTRNTLKKNTQPKTTHILLKQQIQAHPLKA